MFGTIGCLITSFAVHSCPPSRVYNSKTGGGGKILEINKPALW